MKKFFVKVWQVFLCWGYGYHTQEDINHMLIVSCNKQKRVCTKCLTRFHWNEDLMRYERGA